MMAREVRADLHLAMGCHVAELVEAYIVFFYFHFFFRYAFLLVFHVSCLVFSHGKSIC